MHGPTRTVHNDIQRAVQYLSSQELKLLISESESRAPPPAVQPRPTPTEDRVSGIDAAVRASALLDDGDATAMKC